MPKWSYRQKFTVRASSLLLAFVLLVLAFGVSDSLFMVLVRLWPGAAEQMWRFGVNISRYALISSLMALGFLGYSLYRKNPQMQFVLEMLLGLLIYFYF